MLECSGPRLDANLPRSVPTFPGMSSYHVPLRSQPKRSQKSWPHSRPSARQASGTGCAAGSATSNLCPCVPSWRGPRDAGCTAQTSAGDCTPSVRVLAPAQSCFSSQRRSEVPKRGVTARQSCPTHAPLPSLRESVPKQPCLARCYMIYVERVHMHTRTHTSVRCHRQPLNNTALN